MKTILFLFLFLPFIVKAQTYQTYKGTAGKWSTLEILPTIDISSNKDTVKIVMLVSDTSSVGETFAGFEKISVKMQDTRPFMTYGYQTSAGEILDAYKKKLNKNIVMWIAYRTK